MSDSGHSPSDARPTEASVRALAEQFDIQGECFEVHAHKQGHIHDTFVSTWRLGSDTRRYVHQRMNDVVFTDIDGLMGNILAVTDHVAKRLRHQPCGALRTLDLIDVRRGDKFLRDDSGCWRTFRFIDNSISHDRCNHTLARRAAHAFGQFQSQLSTLDPSTLCETIPGFFNSPHRLQQLRKALDEDTVNRTADVEAELAFVFAREDLVHLVERELTEGRIPRRVIHGDTKLNNVLFDRDTEEVVCVIDLDTCMPGYSLYDFGDLVRYAAATSAEDEPVTEKAGIDLDVYRALAEGYLSGTDGMLTPRELELMPDAARLVTLTIGIRFLADYLGGDVYFSTDPTREHHNLERARVQFRMVEDMERKLTDSVTR